MPWLIDRPLDPGSDLWLRRFLGELAEQLDDPATDRDDLVRNILSRLMYARPYQELEAQEPLAAFALDPKNATFEAEYYVATDQARFAQIKPLLWLWRCVDLTPLGQSLSTGIPLRRILARRVFGRAGRNLKIFPHVEVSVGYNIEAGDDVVIHRHVLIDDIGGVELHDGASLSDYVNIYSHAHDILEAPDVTLKRTVIGRGVRVAYHATVLAGTILSDDSMLGAMALATRSLEPHVLGFGIPARPRVWKERGGDPRFVSLAVDTESFPAPMEVRANPDFASVKGVLNDTCGSGESPVKCDRLTVSDDSPE